MSSVRSSVARHGWAVSAHETICFLVSHAQGAEPILIAVIFSKVNHVYTGGAVPHSVAALQYRSTVTPPT